MINPKPVPLVMAVLGVLIATGGVLHWSMLHSRTQRLEQLDREAQTLLLKTQDEQLERRVAKLRDKVAQRETALPARAEIGDMLEDLGADLNDLKVTGRSLAVGTPAEGVVQTIPLTLSFQGSFASAFELLQRLHAYERTVRVERIAISRSDRDAVDALSISARLLTFARSEEVP